MKDAIQVCELKKSYGSHMVLKGLDFQIEKGEIFALLGVNGAGKTTTLECIEGLRKYDSGAITVNGKMGIQLQSSSLPAHIKPMEAVKLFAKWNKTKIDDTMLNGLGIKEMETSVYKGYKQDKIEMRGDRAEMSDFPLYLNTVAGGLDRRDQTIGGFSFVVKIYAVPVVEIIGQLPCWNGATNLTTILYH